ncbi:hypothetical protein ACPA0F_08025 [Solibacillus silvestris]
MKPCHLKEIETIDQTNKQIALARRNHIRLTSHYINVKSIIFYDYVGAVARIGKVINVIDRGLLLQFSGYKETFFFDTLLELEVKGKIEIN